MAKDWSFTLHEVPGAESQRFGPLVLSVVRSDYENGAPSDFTVLVHHDDDGYVFSETFDEVAAALQRYKEKHAELIKAWAS